MEMDTTWLLIMITSRNYNYDKVEIMFFEGSCVELVDLGWLSWGEVGGVREVRLDES